MRSLELLAAVGLLGAGFGWRGISVVAQATTEAVCQLDTWTNNQENQTPCQVAAIVQSVCNGGRWDITPITQGHVYSGPLVGQSNKCTCSTVAFSLVAACGACQGAQSETWTEWKTNCTPSDVTVGGYPLTIPAGTSIPAWAYLDVVSNNVWDPTAALNSHNSGAPDQTGTSSSTAALTTETNAAPSSVGLPSPTAASSSSKSSSNAGPIAGGVVGGVVGLALLALVGFLLWRRNRRRGQTAPSAQFVNGTRGEKVDLVGAATPTPYGGSFHSPPLPIQDDPPRLYDPSDPSTFPSTPAPSQYTSGYVGPGGSQPDHGMPHSPSLPGYTSPTLSGPYSQAPGPGPYAHHGAQGSGIVGQPLGGYSGAPEV